ncbi:MAG TPA: hypothetical protein VG369_01615 [Humibacter sp.]|nr:hypothetical protein [Humibacter sp.]
MTGQHPPLPNEVPGGLPELIVTPDGRIYPATSVPSVSKPQASAQSRHVRWFRAARRATV